MWKDTTRWKEVDQTKTPWGWATWQLELIQKVVWISGLVVRACQILALALWFRREERTNWGKISRASLTVRIFSWGTKLKRDWERSTGENRKDSPHCNALICSTLQLPRSEVTHQISVHKRENMSIILVTTVSVCVTIWERFIKCCCCRQHKNDWRSANNNTPTQWMLFHSNADFRMSTMLIDMYHISRITYITISLQCVCVSMHPIFESMNDALTTSYDWIPIQCWLPHVNHAHWYVSRITYIKISYHCVCVRVSMHPRFESTNDVLTASPFNAHFPMSTILDACVRQKYKMIDNTTCTSVEMCITNREKSSVQMLLSIDR